MPVTRHIAAGIGPAALDAIIDALAANTRVEALYIQNFERVRSRMHYGFGCNTCHEACECPKRPHNFGALRHGGQLSLVG